MSSINEANARIRFAQEAGLVVGSVWKHYRTKSLYVVLGFGLHTDGCEVLVVYAPKTDKNTWWLRPLTEWLEPVYVDDDSCMHYRFEKHEE